MKSFEARPTSTLAGPDLGVLVDGARYPDWDSGVLSVEAESPRRDDQGRLRRQSGAHLPGQGHRVRGEPLHDLEWRMPLGLFKGVRTFTLTPNGRDTSSTFARNTPGHSVDDVASMPDLGPSFTNSRTDSSSASSTCLIA